jgi:DNA-binding MarR family transcriptional regulator
MTGWTYRGQEDRTEPRGADIERDAICAVLWHEDTEAALDLDPSMFRAYAKEYEELRSHVADTGKVPVPRTIEDEPGSLRYEPPYEPVAFYVPKLERLRKWHQASAVLGSAIDVLGNEDADELTDVLRRGLASLDSELSETAKEAGQGVISSDANLRNKRKSGASGGASSLLSQRSESGTGHLPASLANSLLSRPRLDEAAFHGLAGRFVNVVLPHTEADPAALLLCFVTAFGNLVGPGPHAVVSGTNHPARLSLLLVGESGASRKGTAQGCVNLVMKLADADWYGESVTSGLTTGEGLIQAVKSSEDESRRLLWVETEFGRTLTAANREGSTMSAVLRQAWDGDNLAVATRKDALRVAGDHHVSIIGHVTPAELRAKLHSLDTVNGFANRFLFALVRRSKLLPEGGDLHTQHTELADMSESIQQAAGIARRRKFLIRNAAARELWAEVYPDLSMGTDDLVGSMSARGSAQVLRLSLVYALLDEAEFIGPDHLRAALAVWGYCKASIRAVYDPLPEQAVKLLKAIRDSTPDGLTTTDQYRPFHGHITASELAAIRDRLEAEGLIVTVRTETAGRAVQTSYATDQGLTLGPHVAPTTPAPNGIRRLRKRRSPKESSP